MISNLNFFQQNSVQKNNNIAFFGSKRKETCQASLPKVLHPVQQGQKPVNVEVSQDLGAKLVNYANKLGMSVNDYILQYMKHLAPLQGVIPEKSVTANVGKTKVTSLIDAEQIFDKTLEYVSNAKKSIQVEMFEFQNLDVDGDIWPSNGAEVVPGWEQQQKLLSTMIEKKKANPELKVQVILDVHKWGINGAGEKERTHDFVDSDLIKKGLVKEKDRYRQYNNIKMVRYLKENGIDVVPYPRANQKGANLQHVKMLAVDGEKAIVGGMNWGTHSSANHDCCVALETREYKKGTPYKSSEVDNIINDIFNKDWKFAWQRLGATKLIEGPLTEADRVNYSNAKKKIKPENIEYMQMVGELFNNPEDRNRFKEGRLDMVEVNPTEKPAIKVLTNTPREIKLSNENEKGSEISTYIKERLQDAKSLKASLFVLTHKEITNMIIERVNESKEGGRPFEVQILISPDIIEEFPYCRKAFEALESAGVPARTFNVNESIGQRLHTKLAVFDDEEVVIGSANWSAVGLEQNVEKGLRSDYKRTNEIITEDILEYASATSKLEKMIGLESAFSKDMENYDLDKIKFRSRSIKAILKNINKNEDIKLKAMVKKDGKPQFIELENSKKNIQSLKRLLGFYKLIKYHEGRRERFKRGNNECLLAFSNKKIAQTFVRQFAKDWNYSKTEGEVISFTGGLQKLKSFVKSVEPKFNF